MTQSLHNGAVSTFTREQTGHGRDDASTASALENVCGRTSDAHGWLCNVEDNRIVDPVGDRPFKHYPLLSARRAKGESHSSVDGNTRDPVNCVALVVDSVQPFRFPMYLSRQYVLSLNARSWRYTHRDAIISHDESRFIEFQFRFIEQRVSMQLFQLFFGCDSCRCAASKNTLTDSHVS